MKQEGRTDQEVAESFCFLFPDKSKVLMSIYMFNEACFSPSLNHT